MNSPDMTNQAWGLLRAYLAKRGYSQEWIDSSIGEGNGSENRFTKIQKLTEALRR